MGKSKRYAYDYDQYDGDNKGAATMVEDILADPEFPELEELIIGSWGGAYEENCQPILDGIADHAEQFSHIEKLFVGDMDFEDCEVSWILQGDYKKIWKAMPQLKELTIKGSSELELGTICHEKLEALTIICGGLPEPVIKAIRKAELPSLKKLVLYIGVEDYGFDGTAEDIRTLLEQADFPNLTYLGLLDSEIQDELVEIAVECKFMKQLDTLDLSCGTLTDKGGAILLERVPAYPNLKKLDLRYNYLSEQMKQKLESLSIEVNAEENNLPDSYMYPMLTE